MKKIKKLLALIMAMAMVLGMSVTSFAAPKESATITVKDKDGTVTNATFKYVQVIKAAPTTETGWAFANTEIESCYKTAFDDEDAQSIIKKLINFAENKDGAATTGQIADALSRVLNLNSIALLNMNNPQTVYEAGVYAIKANEENFTYNNMAAYVGFGEVKENGEVVNEYPSLLDVELIAKKAPVDLSKEATDRDKVVAIGDIVTYTIETVIPYIDPNATNKEFKVWDKISGADYYWEGENSHFSIVVGDFDNVLGSDSVTLDADNKGFTADLSSYILNDNSNAGKPVLIVYTAKVTAQTVENEAGSNVSGTGIDKDKENLYTGTIELTKYNEDKTEQLAGAGFEVRTDINGSPLTFTQKAEGYYVYDPNGEITEVVTGPSGLLYVQGLDTGMYYFKEVTAPEGYHIANSSEGYDAVAELKLEDGKDTAEAILQAPTELTNTKLSSLPSTGGIGTTIFTIGGCVIMIIAAGLFFASRRKSAK